MKRWLCVLIFTVNTASASAQTVPPTERYCVMEGGTKPINCRFETMEQCKAFISQASGAASRNSCMMNPALGNPPMKKQ